MEPILEFKQNFSNKDYYIYVQPKKNSIYITIETDEMNQVLYWRKNLDSQTIQDTTSQMGSFKSMKEFNDMFLEGLSKKNDSISINFCSLNEIRELAGSETPKAQGEKGIKKYLVIMNNKYEKIVYPIQMDYLGQNGSVDLLKNTIRRIKRHGINNEELKKLKNEILIEKDKNEKLKNENENLNLKIKLLNETRQPGAVENDDIYKNYSELQEKYEKYKLNSENKIKNLNKVIEDLKEVQFKESQSNFHNNEIKKNKIHNLEKTLNKNSEHFYQESKQYAKMIEERNKKIEILQKDIRKYIENEKQMRVKIVNLEKELEKEKRETNYYRYGNYTPKTSKSYKSNYSGSTYKGSLQNSTQGKKSYSNHTNASYLKRNLIPSKYKYRPYKPLVSYKYNIKKKSSSIKGSTSNKSSKRSHGTIGSNSSKGKFKFSKDYISPYRYNKGASPYRYAVDKNSKKNTIKTNSKNSSKNNFNKKNNIQDRKNHMNFTKRAEYQSKNEVKKNNYENKKDYIDKFNKKSHGVMYDSKKSNDFKSIGERLTKIQNLINQVNAK